MPDADAHEGAVGGGEFEDAVPEAVVAEFEAAFAEGTDAGENESVGVGDGLGVAGEVDGGSGGFEGAADAEEVADAVINDGDGSAHEWVMMRSRRSSGWQASRT